MNASHVHKSNIYHSKQNWTEFIFNFVLEQYLKTTGCCVKSSIQNKIFGKKNVKTFFEYLMQAKLIYVYNRNLF